MRLSPFDEAFPSSEDVEGGGSDSPVFPPLPSLVSSKVSSNGDDDEDFASEKPCCEEVGDAENGVDSRPMAGVDGPPSSVAFRERNQKSIAVKPPNVYPSSPPHGYKGNDGNGFSTLTPTTRSTQSSSDVENPSSSNNSNSNGNSSFSDSPTSLESKLHESGARDNSFTASTCRRHYARRLQQARQHLAFATTTAPVSRPQRACQCSLLGVVIGWYANRKAILAGMAHGVVTVLVGVHFALLMYKDSNATQNGTWTLDDAGAIDWRDWVPMVHYGLVHAALVQVALLPLAHVNHYGRNSGSLAACRSSWMTALFVRQLRTMRGCLIGTLFGLVAVAMMVFFGSFDLLRYYHATNKDGSTACAIHSVAAMWTAFGTLLSMLILALTMYYRQQQQRCPSLSGQSSLIQHLAFAALHVTLVAHILIVSPRHANERLPLYVCSSATAIYYLCDQVAGFVNYAYRTNVVASSLLSGVNGTKMIVLHVRRPVLFHFAPGQSASLRIGKINSEWRSLAMASRPDDGESVDNDDESGRLQFYIPVHEDDKWSTKLWNLVEEDRDLSITRRIGVDLRGPHGSSPFATTEDDYYSHAIVVASDSGIFAALSRLKQHVHRLGRVPHPEHLALEHSRLADQVCEARLEHEQRSGSVVQRIIRHCQNGNQNYLKLEDSDTKRCFFSQSRLPDETLTLDGGEEATLPPSTAADHSTALNVRKAKRPLYRAVALTALVVKSIVVLGLALSWIFLRDESRYATVIDRAIVLASLGPQVGYAVLALFIQNSSDFETILDAAVTLVVCPLLDWYMLYKSYSGDALPSDLFVLFCLVMGYITMRTWTAAVDSHVAVPWKELVPRHFDSMGSRLRTTTTERFHLVWLCNSASLVSEVWPDLEQTLQSLEAWGSPEHARAACRVTVHVTDETTVGAHAVLANEINMDSHNLLPLSIRFGPINVASLLLHHSAKLLATKVQSQTLIQYVGSNGDLARDLHRSVIVNDMATTMVVGRNDQHSSIFLAEPHS